MTEGVWIGENEPPQMEILTKKRIKIFEKHITNKVKETNWEEIKLAIDLGI